ncbi:MAG: hypothetical protein ABSG65_04785 [Bryobacteraceae bacterium]|jgi:plastocyanin
MKQVNVTIVSILNPDPVQIDSGDIVVWTNNTTAVQTVSSNDGGQTFTTGPVQPGANSLPITVPTTTGYTVSPAGLAGTVIVT